MCSKTVIPCSGSLKFTKEAEGCGRVSLYDFISFHFRGVDLSKHRRVLDSIKIASGSGLRIQRWFFWTLHADFERGKTKLTCRAKAIDFVRRPDKGLYSAGVRDSDWQSILLKIPGVKSCSPTTCQSLLQGRGYLKKLRKKTPQATEVFEPRMSCVFFPTFLCKRKLNVMSTNLQSEDAMKTLQLDNTRADSARLLSGKLWGS